MDLLPFYKLVIQEYNVSTLEIGDIMAKKINPKNIVILEASATVLCTAFGLIGSYALGRFYPYLTIDTGLNVALSWIIPHTPILFAVTDSLRHELGLKSPVSIIGQSLGGKRRKIPFKANGQDRDIFMFSIGNETNEVIEIDSITVSIDDNNYTISLSDLEYFIRKGWTRQRNNLSAFARRHWTKNERLSTIEYQTRMRILLSINGLVIDRGERRSGKLALPPSATMEAITSTLS